MNKRRSWSRLDPDKLKQCATRRTSEGYPCPNRRTVLCRKSIIVRHYRWFKFNPLLSQSRLRRREGDSCLVIIHCLLPARKFISQKKIVTRCCRLAAPLHVFVQIPFRVLFIPLLCKPWVPNYQLYHSISLSQEGCMLSTMGIPVARERRHFVPGSLTVKIRPLYRNIIHYHAWKDRAESSLSPQLLSCENKTTELVKTYYRIIHQAYISTIG